jgi:hypothetical protein
MTQRTLDAATGNLDFSSTPGLQLGRLTDASSSHQGATGPQVPVDSAPQSSAQPPPTVKLESISPAAETTASYASATGGAFRNTGPDLEAASVVTLGAYGAIARPCRPDGAPTTGDPSGGPPVSAVDPAAQFYGYRNCIVASVPIGPSGERMVAGGPSGVLARYGPPLCLYFNICTGGGANTAAGVVSTKVTNQL